MGLHILLNYKRVYFISIFSIVAFFYAIVFSLAGPSKTIKDWSVYCTDSLVCTMENYEGNGGIHSIGFERGKKANAPLMLQISLNGKLDKNSTIKLSVSGENADIELRVQDGEVKDNVWVISFAEYMGNFLDAMKAGKNIKVEAVSDKGLQIGEKSLSGVVASMIFIDEAQGRIDRQDALQAKGDNPAIDVVTRVSELKSQNQLPNSVRQIWANNLNECSDNEEDIIKKFGGIEVKLDKDGSLYVLPCNFPGAYNMPYVALTFDVKSETAQMRQFPVIGGRGPTTMDTAYNVNWNDKKSQLSAFFRGRGIGDCGSKQIWQWNGDSVYGTFELLEERVKDDCDEKPDDFPIIWPPEEL